MVVYGKFFNQVFSILYERGLTFGAVYSLVLTIVSDWLISVFIPTIAFTLTKQVCGVEKWGQGVKAVLTRWEWSKQHIEL